jgi:MoaA/NifB/PqqE/SkfB family radical SAM enzyme
MSKDSWGTAHLLSGAINPFLSAGFLRRILVEYAEGKAYKRLIEKNLTGRPIRVQQDKFILVRNMIRSFDRALKDNRISNKVRKAYLNFFFLILGRGEDKVKEFEEKYGFTPPKFLTISPGEFCNLSCVGCYAGGSSVNSKKLPYHIVSRILREKKELWNSYFTVISGGEPLLWKSDGKGIIELAKEHSDNFFLLYTNGTLIDKGIAKRLEEMGNITPAISIEGFEKETDARRGKGTFNKILRAFENLREYGIPFGISITATRNNAELIVSDKFIDFCFEKQGALYGWIFQYMPIGRDYNFDLMVTPEQRLYMLKQTRKLNRDRGIFIADFWNSGPISDGCISAGRGRGGYFYIDWKGDVMPCVFLPYSTHNIIEVYKNGGDLNTVLFSPFFEAVRKWQKEYSYLKQAPYVGNQIRPCPIRDHYRVMHRLIQEMKAKPINEEAANALKDKDYYEKLSTYGDAVGRLTEPIWKKEYLAPELDKRKHSPLLNQPDNHN